MKARQRAGDIGEVDAVSGGSRNERLIFVRGSDRVEVPLSIDGIRDTCPTTTGSTTGAS